MKGSDFSSTYMLVLCTVYTQYLILVWVQDESLTHAISMAKTHPRTRRGEAGKTCCRPRVVLAAEGSGTRAPSRKAHNILPSSSSLSPQMGPSWRWSWSLRIHRSKNERVENYEGEKHSKRCWSWGNDST